MDSSHRPLAFNKMEALVQEMQDIENGVPVRSQKLFLTSIPSAFMGYDLIEWLMEHLDIEESVEAVHLANQLCQYGYFFPVSDSKNLVVKDDSSLYRFQIPYYWPWQHRSPDNMEYAIYLAKRTLRNKQRHALEDYELEALNSLKKNLASKWEAITMHAEEQVRLAKDRKKGDKIVADSQERAYWRVHRPPPGYTSLLEPVPVCRGRGGTSSKKRRGSTELHREVQFLRSCLSRTRVKTSVALESLVQHCELYLEFDPLLSGAQPCNPWHLQPSEEPQFWLYNSSLVDVPTEKRVRRWALSMEDLVSDETGLHEFTVYLKKEYNHENIKFWAAVKDLRRSAQSQIPKKVKQIYEEFLEAGAPCEINIDGKTMEKTLEEMKNPSRFTFDSAAEHVYTLLLKKDCYPRFIRSDHYKAVLSNAIQPSTKKRFFGFGGPVKKKASSSAATAASAGLQTAAAASGQSQSGFGAMSTSKRRGSDRSLTGSATELGTGPTKVSHSHSQSNLTEVPYSEHGESEDARPESDNVCPWDTAGAGAGAGTSRASIPATLWEAGAGPLRKHSTQLDPDSGSSSSDVSLLAGGDLGDKFRSCEQRLRRLSTTAAPAPPPAPPPPPPPPPPRTSSAPARPPSPSPSPSPSSRPPRNTPTNLAGP
nr:PREDICTED: regulator of G-protein signaling 7 isoform X2 [Bemisia tabaci]